MTPKCDEANALFAHADFDGALTAVVLAIGEDPTQVDNYGLLGCIQAERGDYYHAVEAFDRYYWMQEKVKRALGDDPLLDGLVPVLACRSYVIANRLAEAIKCSERISPAAGDEHPEVVLRYIPVQAELMRQVGMDRLQAMMEYLIWDTEPIKAMFFLEHCVPAALADLPRVAEMKRALEVKMRHLRGWESYKAEYDAIPPEIFHTHEKIHEFVHHLGRTRNVVAWAKSLPKEGPPVDVLGVGFQDGIIESDAMEQSDRIRLTACDVSPHATQGLKMLQEKFPGRVSHYTMTRDHYDWAPAGKHYDAVFIFEVLEHVPSDRQALTTLHALLKDDGVLFLSTPIAHRWVESYLTGPKGPTWYGHVRAHNPTSLHQLTRELGFVGNIDSTDRGGVFFCHLRKGVKTYPRKVSILVPGTPQPFDPDAHLRGHLGGSEEAVLYLAPALFRQGFEVTVYAPRPPQSDNCAILARDGVQWRASEDFDYGGDHERVLFWRCPFLMREPVVQEAPYRKFLWCHDTHHGVGAKPYEAADGVIVLSRFHADILAEREGYHGEFQLAANGIDLAMFPPLTESDEQRRDPCKAIYASSPDRGLDRVIRAWPMIKRAVTQATLDVYYTWDLFDRACKKFPDVREKYGTLRADTEKLAPLGVTIKGGVDHVTLTEAYYRAGIFAYFCSFEEISCISIMKSMASGCWPVCPPYAALAETAAGYCLDVPEGLDLDSSAGAEWYAEQVIEKMLHPPTFEERRIMADKARFRFGWDTVAARFAEIIR